MAEPRPGEPFVVETAAPGGGRRSPGAAVLLVAAVVVVTGLSVWGVLSGPRPQPPGPSPSGGVSLVSPTPASPAPPPTLPLPRSQPAGLPAVDAASEEDAFAVLAAAGGWRQCPMWRALGGAGTVEPAQAGISLRATPAATGMVEIDDAGGTPRKVWIGSSVDDAARGFGGSAIVRVDGEAWTSIPEGSGWAAVRLDPMTPEGLSLTAWQIRARAVPAPYCLFESIGGPPATVVEETGGDPLVRLYAETGWSVCRTWQRMEQGDQPNPAAVDLAADAAGVSDGPGWVTTTVPADDGRASREVRVYVGDDPAIAGTRHGSQLVVLDTGEPRRAWMATSLENRPFAVAFDVVTTPAGRIAWLPSASAAGVVGDCPAAGDGASGSVEPSAAGMDASTVELLRGGPPASTLLGDRLGWTGCRMVAVDPYPLELPGTAIDRAAVDDGTESGPLRVDAVAPGSGPVTVFLGDDVVDLARWTGDPVVAVDGRPVVWLAEATRADEWRPIITPAGRTAWVETGAATWPDGCDAPRETEPEADGLRSLTCWVERARCLEAVREAAADVPAAFTDATDVAVGPGSACPPPARCGVGAAAPVFVIAAPAGWSSPDAVRVFVTGRPGGAAPDEVPPGTITPAMLARAARPSIALPTADPDPDGPAAGPACRGGTLRGALHGAPWDPRVAWVDDTAVRWPAGDTAVFVPRVRLLAPDGAVLADEGDEVRLVGTGEETDSGPFVACAIGVP